MRKKSLKILYDIITYTLLLVGIIIVMVPIVWLISTALKDNQQIFRQPPSLIPSPVRWENFMQSMTHSGLPFTRFFLNSFIITIISTIGAVISSFIVAFSFARLRWFGQKTLFFIVVMTMVIPAEVIIVPQFIIYKSIGWVDTFAPLIVPSFFGGAFFIFILRQYMMTIPKEMDEAAKIDGCNTWNILWKIIFPQSIPAALAIAIYSIQGHWNAFLEPLIYLSSTKKFTITLGLSLFNGQYSTEWGLLMAASIIVVSPILLMFIFAQKYFIQGVVISGVKG